MKISLPARDTIKLFCLLFVVSFPSIISAEVCGTCPGAAVQTLTVCADEDWDLRDITVATDHTKEYFETCMAGMLGSEITGGGNINSYSGNMANLVYVKDTDESAGAGDSCFQWFSVALATITETATINAPALLCPSGSVLLTTTLSGTGTNYNWSGASGTGTSPTFSATVAGSHALTVDVDGCTVVATAVTVTASSLMATIAPPAGGLGLCVGTSGSKVVLTADVTDASGPLTFQWTGSGGTTDEITYDATTAGVHTLQVTDANCTVNAVNVSTVNKAISVGISVTDEISCNGANDGEVTAVVTGMGSTSYSYKLNTNPPVSGGLSRPFSPLAPGNYSVTATDLVAPGCTATAGPVNLAEKTAMSISPLTPNSPTTVGGSDGSIAVVVANGALNYTWQYKKQPSNAIISGPGPIAAHSFSIAGLTHGTYDVTVTDGGMCTATAITTILPLACPMVIGTVTPVSPTCAGTATGKITVNVSNYNSSYIVKWNGAGSPSGSISAGSYEITGLVAGSYNITVTDVITCEKIRNNVSVSDPTPVTGSAGSTHGACTNGMNGVISVTGIGGGTGPYIVSWSGPSSSMNASSSASTSIISSLINGSYNVVITDSKGCVKNINGVSVAPLTPNEVSITGTDKFCFGQTANGTLTASANPNNLQSFSWSPISGSLSTLSIPNPGNTAVNYSVTAIDNNGCESTNFISVSQLSAVAVTLGNNSKTSVTCDSDNDGSIFLSTSGGNGGYMYSWTGPNNFTSTLEDITTLFPGSYMLTVTDNIGCTTTFTQQITTPLPISVSTSTSDAVCNGDSNGAISVSATGGNGNYSYKWAPGGAETDEITNLSAGIYTVTVTDGNDCFKVVSAEVKQPKAVVGLIDPASTEICDGKSVSLTVSGGTSYAWNNGLGVEPTVTVSPTATTTYTVIVTDANTNFCTDDVSVVVTVNPLPVASIGISETSGLTNNDGTICDGDAITLTASGGSTYNWTGGLANPLTLSPSVGSVTYAVTVTDTKQCTDTESIEVEINEIPTVLMNFDDANRAVKEPQGIKNVSIANCGTLTDCSWTVDGTAESGDCVGTEPTFETVGSKNILLSVTNSCGCTEEQSRVLEISPANVCQIREFAVNNNVTVACVGKALPISIDEKASPGCTIASRTFEVFQDGIKLSPGDKYEYSVANIVFKAPGEYEMKYTIAEGSTECNCSRFSTRSISVIPAPAVTFASDNISAGCEGEGFYIKFNGFDEGEKVVVEFSNGSTFTYEIDSFYFQLGENESETLTILSVQNSSCTVDVVNQKLIISVTPEFKIESKKSVCDEEGFTYVYTIKTSGGDASSSLIASGITGTQSGDDFIITNLDPNKSYSFSLSRGDICASLDFEIPIINCECALTIGGNEATGYAGCESDVFDITNFFKVDENDFNPVKDTIIYVMHNQNTGLNLGNNVYAIYPFNTQVISSDFEGFVPNINSYRLSAVGLKKDKLKTLSLDDPSTLAGQGPDSCLTVISGVPMIWYAEPNPQLGTLNNDEEICRNAYDFMIFAKDRQNGSIVSYSIEGIPEENIKSYGFQDTAFVYFEDTGQDSFVITIYETVEYFDGESTFSCEGSSSFTLYVKDGPGSPPLSDVILWPGNILASTADSLTTCFEWGFENFGQSSGILGRGKYFFAPNDIDFTKTSRTYFVDTYFCNNPSCVTRVYFNADGPNPGLIYKEEESFRYQLKPNPSNGNFTLDLFSDVDGNFDLNIIDITGKKILNKQTSIIKGKNAENFNLDGVEKGIYFIQIINKDRNEYSVDKLVIN